MDTELIKQKLNSPNLHKRESAVRGKENQFSDQDMRGNFVSGMEWKWEIAGVNKEEESGAQLKF